ncbi:MAG: TlpA disulfide reductase family protein [Niabella sp.]
MLDKLRYCRRLHRSAIWQAVMPVVSSTEKKSTITLNVYKDKVLILDFWATWCSSCVKKLPTLYSLQQENKQNLKVILVNSESTGDSVKNIEWFLSKRRAAYDFTSVVEDTILKSLFPHKAIPHYIWIKDNTVIAITDADGITKENVESAISGNNINASITPTIAYDPAKPLFENGNGGNTTNYIYKSVLAPYVDGLKLRIYKNANEQRLINRISMVRCPLMLFYSFAYPVFKDVPQTRVIFNVSDPSRFSFDSSSLAWNKQNVFNYEAQFPFCTKEKAMEILRADLDRYFSYRVVKAEKEMNCWILRTIDAKKITSFPKTLERETNLFDGTGLPIFFNNYPLPSLIHELDRIYNEPFIDETGLDKVPVKLSLPAQLRDSVKLQSSLLKQGLSLTKEKRKIPVVIISDK